MRALPRAMLGAAAIVGVAMAAACSGGDSEPLTLAEFRERANAICRDADEQLAGISAPEQPADLAGSLEEALPLQRAQIEELGALEPPEEVFEQFDTALRLLADQVNLGQQALNNLNGGGDPSEVVVTLGPELEDTDRRLDELARELGLSDCADDGDGA